VETTGQHRQAGVDEGTRDIHRARKLVRLNANQTDQCPAASLADRADDPLGPYAAVGLVVGVQLDIDIRPEDLTLARVLGKRIEAGEGV
jgi:hypothetical protein